MSAVIIDKTAGDITGSGKSVSSFNVNVTNTVSGAANRAVFLVVGHSLASVNPTLSGGAGLVWSQRHSYYFSTPPTASYTIFTAPFTSGTITGGTALTVVNGTSMTGAAIAVIGDGVNTDQEYMGNQYSYDGGGATTGPTGAQVTDSIVDDCRFGCVVLFNAAGFTAPINSTLSFTECLDANFLPKVINATTTNWVGTTGGNDIAIHLAYSTAESVNVDNYRVFWGVSSDFVSAHAGSLNPAVDYRPPPLLVTATRT